MFSREQIDVLYYLVEKGVVTNEDVKSFLQTKLVNDAGFVVTPPPTPEAPAQPAEPVPPAPEALAEGQPAA